MKIAAQLRMAPGKTIAARLQGLEAAGFEAVELLPDAVDAVAEYRAALDASPLDALSMVCQRQHDLVTDQYSQRRRVAEIARLLDGCTELGVKVFVSVAARDSLPDGSTHADRRDAYVRGLELLAPHAERTGVTIVIEALNRYETDLINTLAGAVEIAERVAAPGVKIMADFFHMNLEEPDIAASISAAGDWIAHVHLADSNRYEPGAGHTNFVAGFRALRNIGYGGSMALECRLRGEPGESLAACAAFLSDARAAALT